MRRQIHLYLQLVSIQLRSQMQYRASFWTDLLSSALLSGAFFASIALVLQRFGSVAGWNVAEIAYLAGMAEISFGAMDMLFSGFDADSFSVLVRMGQFDQLLLRPVGISLQVLGSRFVLRRLGRVLEGAVILTIGLLLCDIPWTVGRVLYLPVIFASQVLGMGALFIAGATLIFWTVQPIEAVNILTYGGNEMMTYPMSIYPVGLRRFFTYAVPFIFLNYYPALYILNKPDPLHFPPFAPFLAPVAAGGMLWLALRFWRVGLRAYQGTGS